MKSLKTRLVCFDTEDDSMDAVKENRPKKITEIAAITSDGRSFFARGECQKKFLAWLKTQKPCLAVAHNLAYDMGNLLGKHLDKWDATIAGNKIVFASWQAIEFIDSFNIWPVKLAALGEALGLKKLEMDVHSKEYVMRDCEILLQAMLKLRELCEEFGITTFPCTIGGLAVKIWRAMGGENWHCSDTFARQALFGGRTEIFQPNYSGPCSYTDVNSLYPHTLTFDYPTEYVQQKSLNCYGVACVRIKVPDCFVAPLPLRHVGTNNIYPTGVFEGIWTTTEIQYAVEHGAKVQKVFDVWGSKKARPYYSEFINHFYGLRKASSDEVMRMFYKLLMNNLFGRIAMRGAGLARTCNEDSPRANKDGIMKSCLPISRVGGKGVWPVEPKLAESVNWLHGAYITSYARIELMKYMEQLGERLIYCDTDSTIFTGKPPFKCGPELGQMKLVDKLQGVVCLLPKTYILIDSPRQKRYLAKGVPKNKAKEFITKGKATYVRPVRYREAIRYWNKRIPRYLSDWIEIEKELLASYDKKELRGDKYFPLDIQKIPDNFFDDNSE